MLLLAAAAHACSCLERPLTRELVPAESALPTNGRLRVFFHGAWPAALLPELAAEYRLRGPDGALVPLRADVEETALSLRPQNPLAANTRYVLERLYTYGDSSLLSDDERWDFTVGPRRRDAEPPPTRLVRAWFPERAFTTTAGPAKDAPATPLIQEAGYGAARGGGDCGPGESVWAEVDTTGFQDGDTFGLEVRGQGLVWSGPYHSGRVLARASDMLCATPKVHIDVQSPPAVRVVAWSNAGTRSAASDWMTATPSRDEQDLPRPHQPRPEPDGTAFLTPPIVAAQAAPVDGACANGVTQTAQYRVPGVWRQRGTNMLRAGTRAWLLRYDEDSDGDRLAAVELGLDGVVGQPVPIPNPRDQVVATEGPVPLVVGHRLDGGGLSVSGLRADGTTAWSRAIGEQWPAWHLVGGGPRVFVLYERPRRTDTRAEVWPAWRVLDAATGTEVAHGDLGALGPATDVAGLGWDGTHMVVAWSWDGDAARVDRRGPPIAGTPGSWLARVEPDGAVAQSFAIPHQPHASNVSAAAYILGWRDELTWWEPDGDRIGKEARVPSASVPNVKSIATIAGATVVGGGLMGDPALAAVTPTGGVSSSLWLDGLDPELLTLDGRLMAAHGAWDGALERWDVVVDTYTCRTDAPLGPPARLASP